MVFLTFVLAPLMEAERRIPVTIVCDPATLNKKAQWQARWR
jgi:hypothetical protein